MSLLNEGRNEIGRVCNSDARCLLENWVEERQVRHLEPDDLDGVITNRGQLLKSGNRGLLTTDFEAPASNVTEFRANYKKPVFPGVRTVGRKQELFELMLWEKFGNEELGDFYTKPEPTDFRSVKMVDYDQPDFVSTLPKPSREHSYVLDQPVTFWTEHKDRITGVTSEKTIDTAFRKNDAFSKPIGEYWDEPKPYEVENYPKM